jgi:hypothetical protein
MTTAVIEARTGIISVLLLPANCTAHRANPPRPVLLPTIYPGAHNVAGQSSLGPVLRAELVDATENRKERRDVVKVQTDDGEIVDPQSVITSPRSIRAYSIPIGRRSGLQRTWIFENLSSGERRIKIVLASCDNQPMDKTSSCSMSSGPGPRFGLRMLNIRSARFACVEGDCKC